MNIEHQNTSKQDPVTSRHGIAVKRDQRGNEPSDWKEIVANTDGVSICGDSDDRILIIEATPEAIESLQSALGDVCHIEAGIVHTTGIEGTLPPIS